MRNVSQVTPKTISSLQLIILENIQMSVIVLSLLKEIRYIVLNPAHSNICLINTIQVQTIKKENNNLGENTFACMTSTLKIISI